MATNAETVEETVNVEEDLRKAKEEAEATKVEESPEPAPNDKDAQSTEASEEEEAPAEPDSTLTTEQPTDSDKDIEWYKKAYGESTAEALRLKKELDSKVTPPQPVTTPVATDEVQLTPEQLYIKQKQDEEIADAFATITKNYPQVADPAEYKKFTDMAQVFGRTILDAEKRLATPKELYTKTVIALGWTQDDSAEKLGAALKDGAASPRVSSGSPSPKKASKVSDAQLAFNRKVYPGKTDAEIREELEPYIQ